MQSRIDLNIPPVTFTTTQTVTSGTTGGGSVKPPTDDRVEHKRRSPAPSDNLSARYLASGLTSPSAGNWPWSVLVFGDRGADDVRAAAAGALRTAGRETVNLYRDAAAERRAATELFGGGSQLGRQLRLSNYCTRILVGRLSTSRLSAEDGLVIAQATVTFRLLTPDGSLLTESEFAAKGGGNTDAAAIRSAIAELRTSLPANLSTLVQ